MPNEINPLPLWFPFQIRKHSLLQPFEILLQVSPLVCFSCSHSPNIVRPPYDTMYDDLDFKVTKTARAALHKSPALPPWSVIDFKLEDTDNIIRGLEKDEERQRRFRSIFAMVKLIDDGVGKIMRSLKRNGIVDNTIVVFTSGESFQCATLYDYSYFTKVHS